jgi:REP element-mobilizing transposase RayT
MSCAYEQVVWVYRAINVLAEQIANIPFLLSSGQRGRETLIRLEYPGAMYHVMSRGDQREDILLNDVDRHDFIKSLAEACQKTGWQVHAFCLMSNHYHVVLETPNANLVCGMAWLQSTYATRLNHRQKLIATC